jgi:hypothetical protein
MYGATKLTAISTSPAIPFLIHPQHENKNK